MTKWLEYSLVVVWLGFAILVFAMSGCSYNCRSYTQYKLEQVRRDIEIARDRSIITSNYNWDVVRLFDDLDAKVEALYKDRK